MDLNFSPDDDAFRQEVRAFIRDHYPVEMRVANPHTDLTKQQMLLWHRILHKKGWIAPSWPKEFGGAGWSITQRYIWEQEAAAADTFPPLPFGLTTDMALDTAPAAENAPKENTGGSMSNNQHSKLEQTGMFDAVIAVRLPVLGGAAAGVGLARALRATDGDPNRLSLQHRRQRPQGGSSPRHSRHLGARWPATIILVPQGFP
jgi:hypothetical protein